MSTKKSQEIIEANKSIEKAERILEKAEKIGNQTAIRSLNNAISFHKETIERNNY